MSHTRRSWTDAEDERLRHEWVNTPNRTLRGNPGRFDRAMAAELFRTPAGVRCRRTQLGLVGPDLPEPWTPELDAAVLAGHPGGDRVLADLIGRTPGAIYTRRKVLRQQAGDTGRERVTRPAAPAKTPRPTPPAVPEPSRLPKGWYGPKGSDTAPGTRWVPGARYRRPA